MRTLGILLACLFWTPFLHAQNAVYDSIEQVLQAVPIAQKFDFFQREQRAILRLPDPEQQNLRAYLLRNAAREIGDSISLKYAYELLSNVYAKRGDRQQAAEFAAEGQQVAGAYGWHVDEGYIYNDSYYGYAFSRLDDELRILKETGPQRSFEALRRGAFRANQTAYEGWEAGEVHWVRLELHGSQFADSTFYFAAGYGYTADHDLLTWDTIEVYIHYDDGSVEEQLTGSALPPGERELRDAFNLFEVPLAPRERATLYLRLAGARPAPGAEGIFLEFIDPNSLVELEGFRPIDEFALLGANGGYPHQPVWRSLEVVVDSSSDRPFVDVKNDWEAQRRLQGGWKPNWNHVYWVKLRLLGNGRKAESLLFELPPDRDWSYIDVFWPDARPGYYAQRQLGQRLPIASRFLPHWRSLLQYELLPDDTVDLYLRLEGYLGEPTARRIELHRIDQQAFWPAMPYHTLFDGFALGALAIGMVYFLLRAWLTWDRAQLYFALFLLGVFLCYAFWIPWDRGAVLFPALRPYFDYFLIAGQFLTLFGLLEFARLRLQVAHYFPAQRWVIPGVLGVWFAINLLRALLYGGLLPAGAFRWLPGLYYALAVIGVLLMGALAWLAARRDHAPAYFFLIAVALVLICAVLLTAYWYVEQGWPAGDPVVYILEAGIVFALLFLALGAGYREGGR